MKLNNKGFAISIILYSIIAVIILVMLLILSIYATNLHNKMSLADTVKNNIVVKEKSDLNFLNLRVTINPSIPDTITKGDAYSIVSDYAGGTVRCSVDGANMSGNVSTYTTSGLNTGNHRILCTVTSSDNRTATDTKDITVTYQSKSITNLITDGSFESSTPADNWTFTNSGVVNSGSDGSKSLRLKYSSTNTNYKATATQKTSVKPIVDHKYYGSLMVKNASGYTTGGGKFEWNNTDSVNGRLIFTRLNDVNTDWTRVSYITSIATETYLGTDWFIKIIQVGQNKYSYVDSLILVDLTQAFGAGNEPNLEWCNNHISYFEGTTTIRK